MHDTPDMRLAAADHGKRDDHEYFRLAWIDDLRILNRLLFFLIEDDGGEGHRVLDGSWHLHIAAELDLILSVKDIRVEEALKVFALALLLVHEPQ